MEIKLKRPIKAGDKHVSSLFLDWNKFTVRDYLAATAKAGKQGGPETMRLAEFDSGLHLCLAIACVCRCNPAIDAVDLETQVSGKDIIRLQAAGRSFFFEAAEDTEE